MKPTNQNAVSPVIGVMLMLVVTIIIAAVVTAFAGSTAASTPKTPQATIKGVFSQSGGMQIIHTGGDPIPASTLMFTMTSDGTFGQGLSATSTQIIDKSLITDVTGTRKLQNTDGTSDITSFSPGQTLYINQTNLNPVYLQPQFAQGTNPAAYPYNNGVWTMPSSKSDLNRQLYTNPDNVGKSLTLTMSDKTSGAVIAKTTIIISP